MVGGCRVRRVPGVAGGCRVVWVYEKWQLCKRFGPKRARVQQLDVASNSGRVTGIQESLDGCGRSRYLRRDAGLGGMDGGMGNAEAGRASTDQLINHVNHG